MAAEIVDIAKAVYDDLASDYEADYIVERAYSTGSLWKFGEESEQDARSTRIYVVAVSAQRTEHTRGSELVTAEVHVAVCRKTADIDEQDDVVSLAVTILKDKRRTEYTIESRPAKVHKADHLANPFPDWLDSHSVMASIVRLTISYEVDQ